MSATEVNATILLVDDSTDNLRALSLTLMEAGYQVRCVKSGAMALMAVQAVPTDLVLLDIRLPGLNGYDICQELKRNPSTRDIPIIFLSALDETLDKVKAFRVGGADYITKPFQVEEVLVRVAHQLKIRRLQQQLLIQNQELEQARQAAERVSQLKSDFLVRISHELRTPLNAMLGYSQRLRQLPDLKPIMQEGLDVIAQSGNHLMTLVSDVLEAAAIETGQLPLKPVSFDLPSMVQSLEDMFQLQAESKGLAIIWEQVSDLPRYITGDQQKIQQVLINLLSNAIKFTPSGQVTVQVECQFLPVLAINLPPVQDNSGGIWLTVKVKDTGVGIASDELDVVWQPFVQAEAGRQSHEGIGLGLSISYQMVELMGGQMQINSQLGQGTIVQFTIPVKLAQMASLEEWSRFPTYICQLAEPSEHRLLVVDDRWTNRRLMVRLLIDWGFTVQEAENGREALEIWKRWQPHLIWMDLRMPRMDGYEATKRIKTSPQGISTVIIAMTASTFEQERAIILGSGFDGFIQKPFHEAILRDHLTRHLGVQFICECQDTPPIDSISPSA